MTETFGARLKRLRLSRGLSQRWVAREAGTSDSNLVFLEKGRSVPTAALLERLADVFGCSMDHLWRGTECESRSTSAG